MKNRCAWGKRKAISTIVSVLLMISIAVTGSILVASWAVEIWGSFQRGQKQGSDEKAEAIVMENLWVFPNGTGQVVVRNVGAVDAAIGAVYVDGVLKYSAPSPQGVVIKIGESASFLLSGVPTTAHIFSVATLRGNSASGRWVPVVVTTAAGTTTATTSTTGTTSATTSTTGTSTTVTTITFTTTCTTVTTSTTVYSTTSRFTTTYTTTRTTTSTFLCDCQTYTTVITRTSTVRSTGTTTISTTSTTIVTTTITTVITTTSNLP